MESATSSTGGCPKSGNPLSLLALEAIGEGLATSVTNLSHGNWKKSALVRSALPLRQVLGFSARKSGAGPSHATFIVVRGGHTVNAAFHTATCRNGRTQALTMTET